MFKYLMKNKNKIKTKTKKKKKIKIGTVRKLQSNEVTK